MENIILQPNFWLKNMHPHAHTYTHTHIHTLTYNDT